MPWGRIPRYYRTIYIYLGIACMLAAAVIALAAIVEAARQDAASLKAQAQLIRNETTETLMALRVRADLKAHSSAAYENIAIYWTPDWVSHYFADDLNAGAVKGVAIFTPHGTLRYFKTANGERLTPSALVNADGLKAMLVALWPVVVNGQVRRNVGVIVAGGKPYFAVATAITTSEITNTPNDLNFSFTLMYLIPIQPEIYYTLADSFGTHNPKVQLRDHIEGKGGNVALTDAAGTPRAWVTWQPHRPGSNFLNVLLPVQFIMFLLLLAALGIAVTRWNLAQKEFHAAKAEAIAADEKSRIKSVFLGNVSHELRTPLNAIIGFADMMKMQIFGPLGAPQYREYIDHIAASSQNLLQTISDLIEISQVETLTNAVDCTPVDAALALEEAIRNAQPLAEIQNISLQFANRGNEAWCVGSALRLRQALSRFLEDAIQTSAPGDVILLDWKKIGRETAITIKCADMKFSEEEAENLGKLFLYAGDHMVTRRGGTGLGLVIAVALLKLMGGRITLIAAPNKGMTVFIYLRSADAPAKPEAARPDDASTPDQCPTPG